MLDEVAAVELDWGASGGVDLLPDEAVSTGRAELDTGADDPTDGTDVVNLTLTDADSTVSETVSATVAAGGDTQVVASDTLGGEVWIRATGAPSAALDGTHALLLTTSLHVDLSDGTEPAALTSSGSATVRIADRTTPTPASATDTAALDEEVVTYTADIAFAGDPVGSTWDLDAVAYDADGRPQALGEFSFGFVQVRDDDGNPGPVLGVTGNGKGTRTAATQSNANPSLL